MILVSIIGPPGFGFQEGLEGLEGLNESGVYTPSDESLEQVRYHNNRWLSETLEMCGILPWR
jgi:hypothetical protein